VVGDLKDPDASASPSLAPSRCGRAFWCSTNPAPVWDPVGARPPMAALRRISETDTAIMLATHDVDEAYEPRRIESSSLELAK